MKIALLFALMISMTMAGSLLLKTGAMQESGGLLQKIFSWKIILGLCLYGLGAVVYVVILGLLPLNIAQSFSAAQFVAGIIVAALILREPIALQQWAGITLITAGIIVVGLAK